MDATALGTIARPCRWPQFGRGMFLVLACLAVTPGDLLGAGKDLAVGEPGAPLPFEQSEPAAPLATLIDADAYLSPTPKVIPRQVNFQPPPAGMPQPPTRMPTPPLVVEPPNAAAMPARTNDPCLAAKEKPLAQLGINIALPSGDLPTDHGAVCLASLNTTDAARNWPTFMYQWDATCLCHRPLYFEEINVERYGYGCGCCLQPLASAAHFFGTVPALPYCMAAECPHECVYTLGHYRPGSCPPWRRHWPELSALGAASEMGVWTGLIFLIP